MKKPELTSVAMELYDSVLNETGLLVDYDETANIGKRYRRQDEIGTPFCLTVDPDTLDDKAVTVRDRDTTEQVRIGISEAADYLREHVA